MSQFRENLRTDGRTNGRTEGRTDRPYFIGAFWQWRGPIKWKAKKLRREDIGIPGWIRVFWKRRMFSVGHHGCPFLYLVKAWWWNLITLLNFTKAFRGDIQDFEDARLILMSTACKWLQKVGRSRNPRAPSSKSTSDFTLGKYSKLLLCQYRSKSLWCESFLVTLQ